MINKEQECDIISDLLPLYLENKTGKETGDFIREHMKECEACCKNLKFMESSYEELWDEAEREEQRKRRKKFKKNMIFGKARGKIFVSGYLFFLFCVWIYIIACYL